MDSQEARETICEVGRRLYERDLIGACEGNISVRLGTDRLLSTPGGLCKGKLSPSDMTVIDLEGRPLDGGVPSSEIKMHLRIYARRPDCQAVVHAHPLTATGFALAGETIPSDLLPEAAHVLGPVALVPFGIPGTNEVPDSLEPFLQDHKTLLLSNHGAVVMGFDLWDALHRMETLERIAKILLVARTLGKPLPMLEPVVAALARETLHGRL